MNNKKSTLFRNSFVRAIVRGLLLSHVEEAGLSFDAPEIQSGETIRIDIAAADFERYMSRIEAMTNTKFCGSVKYFYEDILECCASEIVKFKKSSSSRVRIPKGFRRLCVRFFVLNPLKKHQSLEKYCRGHFEEVKK